MEVDYLDFDLPGSECSKWTKTNIMYENPCFIYLCRQ